MQTYRTNWLKGMNTRPAHNVNNLPNGTVAYGVKYPIMEVWKATADGLNVKAGDEWVRLADGVVKWVAVVHLGTIYGVIEGVVDEPTPPVEPPVTSPVFPDWFDLTDPQGNKQRYNRA